MLARNVAISIFEDEDRGFVDFEGEMPFGRGVGVFEVCRPQGVIHVGLDVHVDDWLRGSDVRSTHLLACTDAAFDLGEEVSIEHFIEYQSCSIIENLFVRRSIALVLLQLPRFAAALSRRRSSLNRYRLEIE